MFNKISAQNVSISTSKIHLAEVPSLNSDPPWNENAAAKRNGFLRYTAYRHKNTH